MKTAHAFTVTTKDELGNSYYSESGYSKYNERYKLHIEGKLAQGEEIYGVEQAREHIAELKESVYEGKKHLADKTFVIVETITIESVFEEI